MKKITALLITATLTLGALGLSAGPSSASTHRSAPAAAAAGRSSAVQQARHQSVFDCIAVARSTFAVTGGNFWAAIAAAQKIPGCSNTLSGSICWTSRQWWGSGARWLVSQITGGRYNRC